MSSKVNPALAGSTSLQWGGEIKLGHLLACRLQITHAKTVQFIAQPAHAPSAQVTAYLLQDHGRAVGLGQRDLNPGYAKRLIRVVYQPTVDKDFKLQVRLVKIMDFLEFAEALGPGVHFFHQDEKACLG